MDTKENVQSDNEQSPVADLTVNAVDAEDVKGGAVIYRNVNGTFTQLSSVPI